MTTTHPGLLFAQPAMLSLSKSPSSSTTNGAAKSSSPEAKASKRSTVNAKSLSSANIDSQARDRANGSASSGSGGSRSGSVTLNTSSTALSQSSNGAAVSEATSDYQDYLFADYFAFIRMQADSSFKVSFERKTLSGYETYIVEQWACERRLNTCITSYTGNSDHKIVVSALRIPRDRSRWPTTVVQYFEEISKLHLRPKETQLGLLFVTNISSFPSNLNLVVVPSGKIEESEFLFTVNEDLRRTACTGRSLLTIGKPAAASEDKFRQLFKINDKVPIPLAVVELVTLVQISLYYCGLLEARYADGLLCDVTIHAIKAWWDTWGRLRYGARANEGGMGPTTVAALLGFIIAIKGRLSALGYKPPKDPFDAQNFVTCIRQFQKHEHLAKTGKIDDDTFFRLLSLYEKSSNNDFFVTIRSTMKEVSGKSVQNNCNAETTDLDRLISSYLQGSRTQYLWHGKGHLNPSYGPAVMYCSATGLPISSLQNAGDHGTGNMDLGKAMRSVVTHRRGKSDLPGQSKEDVQYSARLTSANAATASKNRLANTAAAKTDVDPEIYDEETSRHIKSSALDLDTYQDNRLKLIPTPASNAYLLPGEENPEIKRRHSPIRSIHRHRRRSKDQQQRSDSNDGHRGYFSEQHHLRKYLKTAKTLLESPYFDDDDEDDDEDNHGRGGGGLVPLMRRVKTGDVAYSEQALLDEDDSESDSPETDEASIMSCLLQRVHSYDDIPTVMATYERRFHGQLQRRYSTTDIQEAIFRGPCPYILPDAARNHVKNIVYYKNVFDHNGGAIHGALTKLTDRVADYDNEVKKVQVVSENVDYRLKSSFRREQAFKNQVTDLATIGARLQYECRMLETKIRDAEEAVNTFAEKVESLEGRLENVIESRNDSMNFVSRWYCILGRTYDISARWCKFKECKDPKDYECSKPEPPGELKGELKEELKGEPDFDKAS